MAFNGGATMPAAGRRRRGGGRQRARTNRRARQLQPIYDPLQPLQGRNLKQAAGALTNLEIRPGLRALSRQIANINRQGEAVQDRTNDYFTGLGQFGQQAQQGQRTATDRLNAALAGIGADTQNQIAGFGATAQGAMRTQADRGLDGGSWDLLAREVAAQQANAATNSGISRELGATLGSNWEGLASAIAQTDALRGRERLGEIGNAFAQLAAEPTARKADLLASRGALMTRNLGALRDSEREYMLGVEALGLQRDQLRADVRNNRANRRQELRLAKIAAEAEAAAAQGEASKDALDFIANYGISQERFLAMSPAQRLRWLRRLNRATSGQGGGGRRKSRFLPRDEADKLWRSIEQGISVARSLRGAINEQTGRPYTSREIRQIITSEFKDDIPGGGWGDLANAAMDIALNGYLSRANVNALHRMGLRIGRRYKYVGKLGRNEAGPPRPPGLPIS